MAKRLNLFLTALAVVGPPVAGSVLLLGTDRPCLSAPSVADPCRSLEQAAHAAHKADQFVEEIRLRTEISRLAWAAYKLDPKSELSGQYRYWIIFDNDLKLGLLLAGTRHWDEAEAILRHNQTELAEERLAGNDIKSENELLLAHLLTKEGKVSEASDLCKHWKGRVQHLADGMLWAAKHNVPSPPIYDTREVEEAKWELACGQPSGGRALLSQQIAFYPHMLAAYEALTNFYYIEGDFDLARKAEMDGSQAVSTER